MLTLAGHSTLATEIKKSRFVAHAAPAGSPEEAEVFLQSLRDPRATHNCWAYKVGLQVRSFDDGEPGGTAGRPILGAIERLGVDQVVVLVTRFFGGIKLGRGGLVRAYGGIAAACLSQAEKRVVEPSVRLALSAGFAEIGLLYGILEKFGCVNREERYFGEGVVVEFSLPAKMLGDLEHALQETGGSAPKLKRVL